MKSKKLEAGVTLLLTCALTAGAAVSSLGTSAEALTPAANDYDFSAAVEEAKAAMREGTDFKELSYERYDESELKEKIAEVREKMTDAANGEEVAALFDEIEEEQFAYWTVSEIADLHNYIDVTDEEWSDESLYMTDLTTELDDEVNTLGRELLASPCGDAVRLGMDQDDIDYYESYEQMTAEQQELFSKESELLDEYYEASAEEYTVTINGKEYDSNELYYADDITSEQYYAGLTELSQKENAVLGPIYVELVKVRNRIAESYGYDNYTEYEYDVVYERDYSPEDSAELTEAVKTYMLDAYYAFYDDYDYALGSELDDVFSDMSAADQMDLAESYLPDVDERLLESFEYMKAYNLYDLEYSDVKYDGGFTEWLYAYDEPFLYNEPGYGFYDFMSIVHEFGHFNAYYTNIEDNDTANNIDLAEIHSQGLELLFAYFYNEMFGEDYGRAATDYTMIQMIGAVMDGCMYDEFQQKVYAMEDPDLDKINQAFMETAENYGYSYNGPEEACEWVEVPHNFDEPLYYISYAISALPAIELWEMAEEDFDGACDTYMALVDEGEAESFEDTLEKCGLSNPFEESYIQNMAERLTGN